MKQYKKIIDGVTVIKTRNQIVVKRTKTIKDKDGNEKVVNTQIFNPTEELILEDGWVEYTPTPLEPNKRKSPMQVMQEVVFEQYNNRTDITNEEALDRMIIIYDWGHYIGKPLKVGQCVVEGDNVYRVRQDINEVLEVYPPSVVPALYEVIEMIHSGDIDDPIPYIAPMEIFKDKYYIEEGVKFICTRDSGVALTHFLNDLVGIYVEFV